VRCSAEGVLSPVFWTSRGIETPGVVSAGIVDTEDEDEAAHPAFGAELDVVSSGRRVERRGGFEVGGGLD
jgi:hypothetical protein